MAVGSKTPIGLQLADRQLTTQPIGRIVDINLDILVKFNWSHTNTRRAASAPTNLLIALTLLISSVRAASGALDVGRTDRITHTVARATLANLIGAIGRLSGTINRYLNIRIIHYALRTGGCSLAGSKGR
jgi:hypothetical protein